MFWLLHENKNFMNGSRLFIRISSRLYVFAVALLQTTSCGWKYIIWYSGQWNWRICVFSCVCVYPSAHNYGFRISISVQLHWVLAVFVHACSAVRLCSISVFYLLLRWFLRCVLLLKSRLSWRKSETNSKWIGQINFHSVSNLIRHCTSMCRA